MSATNQHTRHNCPDPGVACGCCEGIEPITPQSTANRPGLSALSYRIGTQASFLETMKARLSSHCLGERQASAQGLGERPLAGLSTRDDSDPSIALLDAWATVGDVLTFYQERIANEGYLRTSTERRSVLELSRLIGYNPRPGVAASVYLAYTIDENTPEEVLIASGARVQSVPGPDELPQSFETSEDIRARTAWNQLVPRKSVPQQWSTIQQSGKLYLKGISSNLKPNEPLLISRAQGDPNVYRITAVNVDAAAERTELHITQWTDAAAQAGAVESVRAVVSQLIESAPEGITANQMVEHLQALSAVATHARDEREVTRFIDEQSLPLLATLVEHTRGPAPLLRKWLADAQQALIMSRAKSDSASAEMGRVVVDDTGLPFSERLNALTRKPSRPLVNALQLPRELASSFQPNSDAGLQTLALVAPELQENLGAAIANYTAASPEPRLEVYALRVKAGVFGRNAPKRTRTHSTGEEMQSQVVGEWPIVGMVGDKLGVKTELFDTVFLDGNHDGILPDSWLVIDASGVPVFTPPEDVLVDPAVFATQEKVLIARVRSVATKVARAEYGMTGDTVRIGIDRPWIRFTPPPPVIGITNSLEGASQLDDPLQGIYDNDFQLIRGTAVYAQSERLDLADAPIELSVCDGASENTPLELDGLYQDLQPGRFVIVSGERSDIAGTTGVQATEAVMITEVIHDVRSAEAPVPRGDPERGAALPGDRTHTFIRLDKPLSYCYQRESLVIHGNVVKATHGETRKETLGGGDGARALQAFTLKQSPLTYLAAPTAIGAASTLQVFVNGIRWHEKPGFVDLKSTDHVFITQSDDSNKTTVTFGNGREGARLPTGTENVQTIYRNGIGEAGNVRAGQLSLLSTRPLGVKAVINPLRASGGADRETRDQARRNAPMAVMSLDRLVSTLDYADFARNFAGIGKANAAELSDGRRSVVHVTIAGTNDLPIDIGSDLFLNLRHALIDLGDPFQPVRLAMRELLLLVLSAGVRIDPDYRWENVVTDVRRQLLESFGFERRELAQGVNSSEVLSVIQSVRGVVYVDLDAFGAVPSTIADNGAEEGRRPLTPDETATEIARIAGGEPEPRVHAEPARHAASGSGSGGILPAQLAILVPEVDATLILNQIID